jgi:hypothetical protein
MASDPEALLRKSQLELECLLDFDVDSANRSRDFIVRQAQSCDAKSQGAMHWVLNSPRFRYWIQRKGPDVLLLNGNLEDGMARFSAMSLLCGVLVESLRQQQGVYVLHFFCGMHNSRSDPGSGPNGMIRSLIIQLLSMQLFDTNFVNFGQWKERIGSYSLPWLVKLFGRLIEQLPNMVVFCIIDGISVFEVEPWASELQLVVEALLETVTNELNAHVKMLFACATASRYLSGRLAEQNKLSIPMGAGDSRLLTDRTAYLELDRDKQLMQEEDTGWPIASHYRPSYADVYEQGYE